MNMNNQMEESEANILHTYNRFPVVFEHGEGVHLYDSEGNKYLDFAAGIAVNSLGYHYPGYDEALKDQIDKLTHISNLSLLNLHCCSLTLYHSHRDANSCISRKKSRIGSKFPIRLSTQIIACY